MMDTPPDDSPSHGGAENGSRLLRQVLQAFPGYAALVDGQGLLAAVNPAWLKTTSVNPFLLQQLRLGPARRGNESFV